MLAVLEVRGVRDNGHGTGLRDSMVASSRHLPKFQDATSDTRDPRPAPRRMTAIARR